MMPPVAVARKLSDNEHQIMERGAPDILPLIPTAAKTDSWRIILVMPASSSCQRRLASTTSAVPEQARP